MLPCYEKRLPAAHAVHEAEGKRSMSVKFNVAVMAAADTVKERQSGCCRTLGCRKLRQPCEGTRRDRGPLGSCRGSRRWVSRRAPLSNSYAQGATALRQGRYAGQGEAGGQWDGAGGAPPVGKHEQSCVFLTTRPHTRTPLWMTRCVAFSH